MSPPALQGPTGASSRQPDFTSAASPAALLPTASDSVYPTTSVPAQPTRCLTGGTQEYLRGQ